MGRVRTARSFLGMTAVSRFVVYCRLGFPEPEEMRVIANRHGFRIVDEASDRALLVEADPEAIQRLQSAFPEWVVGTEVIHLHPDVRPPP